jgi:hypothetical protein
MSNDDLNRFLAEIARALFDPTAPLPSLWPSGVLGVFLIFVTQIGAGIPLGVLLARDSGLSPLTTAGLYFASDLVLAVTVEPILILVRSVSKRNLVFGRVGGLMARFADFAGLHDGRARGPLGLILISFSINPTVGRAASVAAGHGFVTGWTLAIIGDMAYFGLVMVSTLWVSSVLGDDRLTIGAVLLATWVIPLAIRHFRRRAARPKPGPGSRQPALATPAPSAVLPGTAPRPARRKSTSHTGRRRATRGLHR